MIKLGKLVARTAARYKITEAENDPAMPATDATESTTSYIDSKELISRLNSIIDELNTIDDEIMNALENAESETGDIKYGNAKAVISRYLSAGIKNIIRLKQPIKKLS